MSECVCVDFFSKVMTRAALDEHINIVKTGSKGFQWTVCSAAFGRRIEIVKLRKNGGKVQLVVFISCTKDIEKIDYSLHQHVCILDTLENSKTWM